MLGICGRTVLVVCRIVFRFVVLRLALPVRVIAAAGTRVCTVPTAGGSSNGFESEVAADTVLVVGGDVLVVVEARGVSNVVLRLRDFNGPFAFVYADDLHRDQGRLEA